MRRKPGEGSGQIHNGSSITDNITTTTPDSSTDSTTRTRKQKNSIDINNNNSRTDNYNSTDNTPTTTEPTTNNNKSTDNTATTHEQQHRQHSNNSTDNTITTTPTTATTGSEQHPLSIATTPRRPQRLRRLVATECGCPRPAPPQCWQSEPRLTRDALMQFSGSPSSSGVFSSVQVQLSSTPLLHPSLFHAPLSSFSVPSPFPSLPCPPLPSLLRPPSLSFHQSSLLSGCKPCLFSLN